ncbi:hypothetical protein [Actinoplanes sp. N902-109]|uniref:hypothetical protein n=1 Tax=Actinoplanes sp. (strain N902-109) TaxID=649831 RepID=UPI00059FC99B|nr:hypothetical protein [Actinoplanes sp. N902-109]
MIDKKMCPLPTLDREAVTAHLNAAHQRLTPVAVWTAVADIPVMLAEIDRLSFLASRARWDLADLLAAARATLAADNDGENDALDYLRDAVAEHRTWAPPDDDR